MKYKTVKVPEEFIKAVHRLVGEQNDIELDREYYCIREEIRKFMLALRRKSIKNRNS